MKQQSKAISWGGRKCLTACVGAFLALSSIQAVAGIFTVTPVRIYMTPKDRAIAVTITNEGDSPVALQADISEWKQKSDGSDELTLTEDLILSPPIIKLGPKARQVVRLALLVPADATRQLTYRLVLREIPEATAPKKGAVEVPIALALSMPVFITPPVAKRDMSCSLARGDAKALAVTCANTGSAYSQIREISVKRKDKLEGRFEGGVYVLPGAKKTIAIPTSQPVAKGPMRLAVSFDDGKEEVFDVALP